LIGAQTRSHLTIILYSRFTLFENYKIKKMKKFDLQERLIKFSIDLIKTLDKLPNYVIGKHLKGQLTRSGTSPTLNYAEACDAESRKDFMHKIKIVLKELRETLVELKMIDGLSFTFVDPKPLLKECDELLSIFNRSYITAKSNMEKERLKIK
jgi:four helix bundle protein